MDAGKLFDSQRVSYPVHLVAIAANGACAVVHYMDGRDDHRALYLEEGNGWATSIQMLGECKAVDGLEGSVHATFPTDDSCREYARESIRQLLYNPQSLQQASHLFVRASDGSQKCRHEPMPTGNYIALM